MKDFKLIKKGVTYIPVQVTTFTGAIVELYVNEAEFNSGEVTEAFTFEELRDLPSGLKVILNKD